jgi:hypothetical protein
MKPIRVSVINASTMLKDDEIPPVIAALQIQVSEHLAPKWQVDATLEFVPLGQKTPDGNWRLELLDKTNLPPDSGYHSVNPDDGTPYGRVFLKTVEEYHDNWTITASHELLEMLVNPYTVLSAYVPFDDYTGTFVRLEICDPVSPDVYGYEIEVKGAKKIAVSDFVFPEWFAPFLAEPPNSKSRQVDYCKHLTKPAPAIVPGTTVSVLSVRGWQDLQSEAPAGGVKERKDATSLRKQIMPISNA